MITPSAAVGNLRALFLARVTSTLDDVSANVPRGCCVPGDIAVLANCRELVEFDARDCEEISGEEPSRTLAG